MDDYKAIKKRMRALLEKIESEYDFARFTMADFARWLEGRRGKQILFVPWAIPGAFFGAWVSTDEQDFIFYDLDALSMHQGHIQLHELSHILCGHEPVEASKYLVGNMLTGDEKDCALLLRSAHSDDVADIEAETLTALIQEKVLRLQKIPAPISSDGEIAEFLQAVGLE